MPLLSNYDITASNAKSALEPIDVACVWDPASISTSDLLCLAAGFNPRT